MASLLTGFSIYKLGLTIAEGYATGLDIPADVLGVIFGIVNLLYHYIIGGFKINLVWSWILVIFFFVPYWTLTFMNTLTVE